MESEQLATWIDRNIYQQRSLKNAARSFLQYRANNPCRNRRSASLNSILRRFQSAGSITWRQRRLPNCYRGKIFGGWPERSMRWFLHQKSRICLPTNRHQLRNYRLSLGLTSGWRCTMVCGNLPSHRWGHARNCDRAARSHSSGQDIFPHRNPSPDAVPAAHRNNPQAAISRLPITISSSSWSNTPNVMLVQVFSCNCGHCNRATQENIKENITWPFHSG